MLLDKSSLMAVLLAAKEKMRYTLSNLRITKTHTEATNGRCLARVKHPDQTNEEKFPQIEEFIDSDMDEEFETVLISRPSAVALAKRIPAKAWDKKNIKFVQIAPDLTNANDDVHFGVVDGDYNRGVTKVRKQGGTFPDFDTVIPGGTPKFRVALDLGMLSEIAKVMKQVLKDEGKDPDPQAIFEFYSSGSIAHSANNPVKIRALHAPDRAEFILMPTCID